jgi:hypothetical protein
MKRHMFFLLVATVFVLIVVAFSKLDNNFNIVTANPGQKSQDQKTINASIIQPEKSTVENRTLPRPIFKKIEKKIILPAEILKEGESGLVLISVVFSDEGKLLGIELGSEKPEGFGMGQIVTERCRTAEWEPPLVDGEVMAAQAVIRLKVSFTGNDDNQSK